MKFAAFSEMLGHFARLTPDSPALLVPGAGGRERVSFAELEKMVSLRADALSQSEKTCLGVFADGSLECVVTVFAAVRAGMQVVLLPDALPEDAAERLLAYTDADMLWSSDEERVESLAPCLGNGVENGGGRILFFTSGTTQEAKAVVLTEKSLMASAWNGSQMLPLEREDILLCMLPLDHVFGFVCGLLWGLSCGACVALGRGARHYADDCGYYAPTAVSAVPALLKFLLGHRLLNPELSLVLVGAGACPRELLSAAAERGLRVSFGYGLTETSSGVAISTGGDPYAMDICPEDTITLAPDGEILIEAPTCMMQGYYKRPEDTAAAVQNGVLRTGDLGEFDADGRLHITGRKKDILVLPSGTKLFLPEYEAALSTALGTGELAVILDGERPALIIKAEREQESAIRAALRPLMAAQPRSKQIGNIYYVNQPLPRTATGKLRRWEITKLTERGETP